MVDFLVVLLIFTFWSLPISSLLYLSAMSRALRLLTVNFNNFRALITVLVYTRIFVFNVEMAILFSIPIKNIVGT